MYPHRQAFLVVVLVALVVMSLLPLACRDIGETNLYVHQANAFLHGRLHVNVPRGMFDVAHVGEYDYVVFPPFPAALLLPIVAVFGTTYSKVTVVSLALTLLNAAVLSRVLERLSIDRRSVPWLLGAFFLGTGYWLCMLVSSGVWFFAHVVAVTCLLLAMNEALGRRRPLLVGCYLSCAFLSRQLCFWSLPFLAIAVCERTRSRSRVRQAAALALLALPVLVAMCVYFAFNWARFGDMWDTGYSHLDLAPLLEERVEKYGLFHPAYFVFNLVHMFLQGPHITFSPPTQVTAQSVDSFGTSITFASPFLFAAFAAKWRPRLLWAAWASVAATLVPMLFYHNNGWVQINTQRFSLDFLPVLMVLVALGTERLPAWLWKAAICYSIGLNVVFLWLGGLISRAVPIGCILALIGYAALTRYSGRKPLAEPEVPD